MPRPLVPASTLAAVARSAQDAYVVVDHQGRGLDRMPSTLPARTPRPDRGEPLGPDSPAVSLPVSVIPFASCRTSTPRG